MTNEQALFWFAGLYEGEGSVQGRHYQNKDNGRFYFSLSLRIDMTDEDTINTVQKYFGGKVNPRRKLLPGRKQTWIWQLAKKDEVIALAEKILPYLSIRRRAQLNDAITRCKAYYASKNEPLSKTTTT